MLKKFTLSFLFIVLSMNCTFAALKINGAGATFPYPIYSKWFAEFQKSHKDVEFNYQSIGSGGGIKQVLAQTVDFGASDAPMTDEELKTAKFPIRHIPTVIGAVTAAYNVKGLADSLNIDGTTLANIFLGKISKWNDPAIAKLNPKAKLPNVDILVVRRSDGSGTTSVFTTYLADTSPEFQKSVGAGKNVNWPAGIGAKGNEGVTAMISQTDGAIGYIELAYALNNKLNTFAVKNKSNEFIKATSESISKAATFVKSTTEDLRISVINSASKGAYPISSFTWILLPTNPTAPSYKSIQGFLNWALTDGQKFTKDLHYAPLPKSLSAAIVKKL